MSNGAEGLGARRLGGKILELALEALMIVFAVLIALGFEEWREERQLQEFADRAVEGVLAEVRANLDEFRDTDSSIVRNLANLQEVVNEEDLSLLNGNLSFSLPDISSAAWSAAQMSQAAAYLDYDWVIEVSRVYAVGDMYSNLADRVIDGMAEAIGRTPSIDVVSSIYGRLVILYGIHGQIEERLEALLEEGS